MKNVKHLEIIPCYMGILSFSILIIWLSFKFSLIGKKINDTKYLGNYIDEPKIELGMFQGVHICSLMFAKYMEMYFI